MRLLSLRHYVAAILAIAIVLPASSLAGVYFNLGFGIGCGGCGLPFTGCSCPPCGTCMQPRPACVCPPTYAPPVAPVLPPTGCAPSVQIQRQAFIEQVPVTTYQQVTETVYVPQQITRTIPRTIMTQQTRYRDIAVQTTPTFSQHFTPVAPAGCSSCGSGGQIGFTPTVIPGYPTAVPTSVTPIPSMPAISVSPYGAAVVPPYDDVSWSDVRPRFVTDRAHAPIRGAFRPAPSAATVWQSRF